MTDTTPSAIAAIKDARALLDTLLGSDWREVHVISGVTEIFMARPGGRANPMRGGAGQAAGAPVPAAAVAPVSQGKDHALKAPHVATLVSAVDVGRQVAAGETVAVLRVLDEEIPLAAAAAGKVLRHDAAPGSLLDFDAPILTLSEVA